MKILFLILIVIVILLLTQRQSVGGYMDRSRFIGRDYAPAEGFCGCNSNGSQCNNAGNMTNSNNIEGFTPKRGGCGCQSSVPSPFL